MVALSGKRALVCGSSQGIGRACAFELARQGAQVTLFARNEVSLRAVRDALPPVASGEAALEHYVLCADFRDPTEVEAVARRHVEQVGTHHILINNTGGPAGGPALDADAEEYVTAFASHLLCNQALARLLVPGMKAARYGRIINIISTSVKQPIEGLGVSNTIRGAVASWAKTIAGELAPSAITVNNVLPGATSTGRLKALIESKAAAANQSTEQIERALIATIPTGRFGEPEEIAAAVGFLASPAAAYITGINLPVDGGRTASL